jgi:hypothetical protein
MSLRIKLGKRRTRARHHIRRTVRKGTVVRLRGGATSRMVALIPAAIPRTTRRGRPESSERSFRTAGRIGATAPAPLFHHARNYSKRKFGKRFFVHAGQDDAIGVDVQNAVGALTISAKRCILYGRGNRYTAESALLLDCRRSPLDPVSRSVVRSLWLWPADREPFLLLSGVAAGRGLEGRCAQPWTSTLTVCCPVGGCWRNRQPGRRTHIARVSIRWPRTV